MPTNVPPQYRKAEADFRRAGSPAERLEAAERMLRLMPKHKGTDKLQAAVRKTIASLKTEVGKPSAGGGGRRWKVPRLGAGRGVLVGPPNVGKSRLLKELTGADVKVEPYPYTTREPNVGLLDWGGLPLQLVDTPPLAPGPVGADHLNLVRAADLVLVCLNGADDDSPQAAADLLTAFSDRTTVLADESDPAGQRVRSRLLWTHSADPDFTVRREMFEELAGEGADLPPSLSVELNEASSVAECREAVGAAFGLIRIYTKRPGQDVERKDPFAVPSGGCVEDVAWKVHEDLAESLTHARVWTGRPADASGPARTVGREHTLQDGDVVELHTS